MVSIFSGFGLVTASRAEFLAVIQILVPAGALMVLYLFVVFLFNLSAVKGIRSMHRQSALAAIVAVALLLVLAVLVVSSVFPGPFQELIDKSAADNTTAVGGSLYTSFLFPFELASLVLLAVMFGAIVLARREGKEE